MNSTQLAFSTDQFSRIFPFYICLDRQLKILDAGTTLKKLIPNLLGEEFHSIFVIKRPEIKGKSYTDIVSNADTLIVIEHKDGNTELRCQVEVLADSEKILFIGSPWFSSMEEVISKNLTLSDFAVHDPLIDLLHVLKTQEIGNNDMKELLSRLHTQKEALKASNREISEIALFPTQNPDPLLRVDLKGEILRMNPPAEEIETLIFEGKSWTREQFWRERIIKLDITKERTIIEASVDDDTYSFNIIPIPDYGYFNVYGRRITEQKIIENELSASARRLASVIQNHYAGVLLESEDRHIVLINQEFCSIFNIPVSHESLVGTDCSQAAEQSKHLFLEPEKFVSRIDELLAQKQVVVNELLETTDGGFLQRDFIPIWKDNEYTGHLWLYVDVTEKVNSENQLEQQRIFYNDILGNINSDIVVYDSDLKYLFVNPKALPETEQRNWVIGKTDQDRADEGWISSARAKKRIKIFREALRSGQLMTFEEEIKSGKEKTKYILYSVHPVSHDKQKTEMLVVYGVDISEIRDIQRKMEVSEKQYRNLVENSLALITTHDLEGRILSINRTVETEYGYTIDEMKGSLITDYMDPSEKRIFHEKYLKELQLNKQVTGVFKVNSKKGQVVYTLFNNFLKEEKGNKPYVIGYGVNITDRVIAEKELKRAKAVTEELSNAKQEFFNSMSHEIRTPLNAIIGLTNQLLKSELNPLQSKYLITINQASDHLLSTVNDILDIAKLEAGKLVIEKIPFEPKKLFENAIQLVKLKAEEKGLKLTNSVGDSNLSRVLIGDPNRISQVLYNLLGNAVKYTDRGFVDLRYKVDNEKKGKQKVQITIEDSGIGMDEKFIDNLFEKFSQENRSRSSHEASTGLGMNITKKLIDQMGGEIVVRSEKEKGTLVNVVLNLPVGSENDLPESLNIEPNKNILMGKKILVADDNENNHLVSSIILSNYGAQVAEVYNGKEVLEYLEKEIPDLILMDIQMPELNGLEATRVIRKLGIRMPILALTANVVQGEKEKCYDAGMDDYISKPYRESELIQKLAYWLKIDGEITEDVVEEKPDLKSGEIFNYDKLHKISPGNEDFVRKMAELFCKNVPDMLEKMNDAADNKDIDTVAKIAHKMIPTADDLNIQSISGLLKELEAMGEDSNDFNQISAHVTQISNVLADVLDQIRSDYKLS